MTDGDQLRVKAVQKLARKKVVGSHRKRVDTVENWFATDQQGRVEAVVRGLIRGPAAPVEGYGGSRDAVRLTRMDAARASIQEHGGELPWGLRED